MQLKSTEKAYPNGLINDLDYFEMKVRIPRGELP
jgi:hypothetical protein